VSRHHAEPLVREYTVLTHALASAVEPLEAAVVLESAGVNDRVARDLFGTADVLALAAGAMAHAGPDRPVSEPLRARAEPADPAVPRASVWFHLRGILYAVPALVTLALLPSVDPVESALVLGGLILSWAWCYGVASIAWAHLGNQDAAGARWFLRCALFGGALLATLLATLAVLGALMLTTTMDVTMLTVALLAGQTLYLLSAATLLMTGRELLLLVALVPALGALVLAVAGRAPARVLHWAAASVLLAAVLAVVATRRARRPRQRLGASAWGTALKQWCYGLLVAVVVLFPAINELVNQNYDALPLSVTLAALPLVLSMGIAETLLHRFRERMADLLATSSSSAAFARAARRAVSRYHVAFALPLVSMSAALGLVVARMSGSVDARYGLLALGYVVLGTAVFAAMLLNLLGRTSWVLATLGATVVALAAFEGRAAFVPQRDSAALVWLAAVATLTLLAHVVLVRRVVVVPVSHR
jgi:hypothetical protein